MPIDQKLQEFLTAQPEQRERICQSIVASVEKLAKHLASEAPSRPVGVQIAAHDLKSYAAMLGHGELESNCAWLEQLKRREDFAAPAAMCRCAEVAQQVEAMLREFRATWLP